MIRIMKSLVLGLLIIASLYQVITLWFDNVSDRNFFYSFIEKAADIINEPIGTQKKEYMIRPRQLGVYLGASDKDFTVVSSTDTNYQDLYNKSMEVMIEVMKNGRLFEVYQEDDILWKDRGLVFTLPTSLEKADLAFDLGISQNRLDGLTSTTTLGLIPANNQNNLIKVYIIDEASTEIYMYTLTQKNLQKDNELLNTYIDQMDVEDMTAFISTFKEDIPFFKNNSLIPLATENLSYTGDLEFSVPFVSGDELDLTQLRQYVNNFFSNPDVVYTIPSEKRIVFGDDRALLKYSKLGVLVYSSIAGSGNANTDLSTAFNVAQKFMEHDHLLTRSMYTLKAYKKDAGAVTFYYDYTYNDHPILLEQEEPPIEVTVEGGKVTRYQRQLINLVSGTQDIASNVVKFEDALNTFLSEHSLSAGQLEDMYLCYQEENGVARLKWCLEYKGELYYIEI